MLPLALAWPTSKRSGYTGGWVSALPVTHYLTFVILLKHRKALQM